MTTKKVRLTHVSNLKGAEGVPGDELAIDADLAERWEQAGGCVILGGTAPAESPKPAKPPAKVKEDK